jgi:uncharacterized DUF497 family protein
MQYEWDEAKRKSNLKQHGYDFASAESVFAGLTVTYEDGRFDYPEQRFVTLGLLDGLPVSVVHTEVDEIIRIISFREATSHETQFLFQSIADQLSPGAGATATPPRKAHGGASRDRPKPRNARRRKKGTEARPA